MAVSRASVNVSVGTTRGVSHSPTETTPVMSRMLVTVRAGHPAWSRDVAAVPVAVRGQVRASTLTPITAAVSKPSQTKETGGMVESATGTPGWAKGKSKVALNTATGNPRDTASTR